MDAASQLATGDWQPVTGDSCPERLTHCSAREFPPIFSSHLTSGTPRSEGIVPLPLSEMMSDANSLVLWIVGAGVGASVALVVYLVVLRGRRVPGEHVFRASRWSRGNHVFPTQVAVTPTSVVHYTPEWFGRRDQSIHMAHVASVLIDTNLFPRYNEAYKKRFSPPYPARTTVGSDLHQVPGMMIEIEAIAYVGE